MISSKDTGYVTRHILVARQSLQLSPSHSLWGPNSDEGGVKVSSVARDIIHGQPITVNPTRPSFAVHLNVSN